MFKCCFPISTQKKSQNRLQKLASMVNGVLSYSEFACCRRIHVVSITSVCVKLTRGAPFRTALEEKGSRNSYIFMSVPSHVMMYLRRTSQGFDKPWLLLARVSTGPDPESALALNLQLQNEILCELYNSYHTTGRQVDIC